MRCNGSIIEYGGRYLIAARKGWRRITLSDLVIGSHSDDTNPSGIGVALALHERELRLSDDPEVVLADPRLMLLNCKLHCSYIQEKDAYTIVRQAIATIDRDGQVLDNRVFQGPSDYFEKNWQFFEHQGKILFTYALSPWHLVLDLDYQVYGSTPGIWWDYGEARGSTPPVLDHDHFCGLFQSHLKRGGTRHYYVGWYEFSRHQPFHIHHHSRVPLILPPEEPALDRGKHHVVFPCGLFKWAGAWYASYGHNDSGLRVLKINPDANLWGDVSLRADDGLPVVWA